MKINRRLIVWPILAAILYVLLSYHFIFVGKSLKLLKKSRLTLEYTVFSTAGKTNESILRIDELREAGIGELLIDAGKMTEEEMDRIIDKLEEEYYD